MIKLKIFVFIILIFFSCAKGEKENFFHYEYKQVGSFEVLVELPYRVNSTILIDNEGAFYLSDPIENKILKFDKKGKKIDEVGGIGRGPGEFEDGKVILLSYSEDNIYAYVYGGFHFNIYNSNLELLDIKTVNDRITSLNKIDKRYIMSFYMDGLSNFIEIRDSNFQVLENHNSPLKVRNKYFRNLNIVKPIKNIGYIVSYLSINKINIISYQGEMLKAFSIPGIEEIALENKDLKGNPPKSLLIRDLIYDSISEKIYILEGGKEGLVGSKFVHILNEEGKYLITMQLPIEIELIRIHERVLYGLQTNGAFSQIIRFEEIE